MTRPSWDMTWLAVAGEVARRSVCDGRAIGAVIVSRDNRIVATGYNGAPAGHVAHRPGSEHTLPPGTGCRAWCPRMQPGAARDLSYANCLSVHAEVNAIAYADRRSYEGGTLYVTSAICWDCGKIVANSGIRRIVMQLWAADKHRDPQRTISFLRECGIAVVTKEEKT